MTETKQKPKFRAEHRGQNRVAVVDGDGMVYAMFGTVEHAEQAAMQLNETGKLNHSEVK